MSLNKIKNIVTYADYLNKDLLLWKTLQIFTLLTWPKSKTGINQRNVTNSHDQHTDTNNFYSNIIKCNKNQKKKWTRRSNKQKTSKILNIIYSNARGIKSKKKHQKNSFWKTVWHICNNRNQPKRQRKKLI